MEASKESLYFLLYLKQSIKSFINSDPPSTWIDLTLKGNVLITLVKNFLADTDVALL